MQEMSGIWAESKMQEMSGIWAESKMQEMIGIWAEKNARNDRRDVSTALLSDQRTFRELK